MNLFGCLFPCALQQGWWGGGSPPEGATGAVGGLGAAPTYNRNNHNHHSHNLNDEDDDDEHGCMSDDEFVRRMGVNASTLTTGEQTGNTMSSAEPPMPGYRDTIGVIIRERKKKVTGFATLKKKFIRRRRSSKACDHGRMLRELVSNWTPLELSALLEEYDALAALKDLCVQAELARPPAATFKQDLSALYDFKYCTDADLVYRGACFPVHRALLSVRCPYFRDLLAGCPGYGARICLELRTATVDVQLFSALLRYLYTGDICAHDSDVDMTLLRRLREEFGAPNPLEHDLRYLLESGDYADAALVFTSDGGANCALPIGANGNNALLNPNCSNPADCHQQPQHHHHHGGQSFDNKRPESGSGGSGGSSAGSGGSEYGFRPKLELPCHKAILSARSHFFRNLLQRRCRSGEEHTERALHIPTRIVLDENVIPKRYAKVLLHAVYLDHVDLSLIARGGYSGGGLGEAQALAHTGRARPTALEEAMELYQIGRFLELDILSQGCEDLILECLGIDTLPAVLQWAKQPYGSAWVHRQAIHFLREEFQPIAQSVVLHQLDKLHLSEVLKSPFLQASEQEILQAVLKWGENELVRRMEDREPNLLCHTAHSVARKGVKKRDLSDIELRDILADLLPLVRTDHVLPAGCDVLQQVLRRGLLSQPPSCMLGGDNTGPTNRSGNNAASSNVHAWVRAIKGDKGGLYQQPRLFMPYYEELKVLLEDQLVHDVEIMRLRRSGGNNTTNSNNSSANSSNRYATTQQLLINHPDNIPDTLYMVGNEAGSHNAHSNSHHHHHHHHHHSHGGSSNGNGDYGKPIGSTGNQYNSSSTSSTSAHHHHHHAHHQSTTHHHLHPSTNVTAPLILAVANQQQNAISTAATTGPDVLASILPVPDPALMTAMLKRERKLRAAPGCQRSLAMPLAARSEILRQIRLRVVREFNMPDAVADMLLEQQRQHCYCLQQQQTAQAQVQQQQVDVVAMDTADKLDHQPGKVDVVSGVSKGVRGGTGQNMTFPRNISSISSVDSRSTGGNVYQAQQQQHGINNYHLSHSNNGRQSVGSSHHNSVSNVVYHQPQQQPLQQHHLPSSTLQQHELPSLVGDTGIPTGRYLGGGSLGSGGYHVAMPGQPEHHHHHHHHHHLIAAGLLEGGGSTCGESGHLSDIMPDVAMATAGLGQMHIQEASSSSSAATLLALQQQQLQPLLSLQQQQLQQEMELDLGDGAAHLLHSGGGGVLTTPNHAMTMQHPLNSSSGSGNSSYRRYARSDGAVSPAASIVGLGGYHGPAQPQIATSHHLPPPSPSPLQQQQAGSRPDSQQSYHGSTGGGSGGILPPRFL